MSDTHREYNLLRMVWGPRLYSIFTPLPSECAGVVTNIFWGREVQSRQSSKVATLEYAVFFWVKIACESSFLYTFARKIDP